MMRFIDTESCGASSPDGWVCTQPVGHDGQHVATDGGALVFDRWGAPDDAATITTLRASLERVTRERDRAYADLQAYRGYPAGTTQARIAELEAELGRAYDHLQHEDCAGFRSGEGPEDCTCSETVAPDSEWCIVCRAEARTLLTPTAPAVGEGHTICPGCRKEIDPDCCGCGSSMDDHSIYDGHSPVPMGCDCMRDVAPTPALPEDGEVEDA